jgi:hypothetical protein
MDQILQVNNSTLTQTVVNKGRAHHKPLSLEKSMWRCWGRNNCHHHTGGHHRSLGMHLEKGSFSAHSQQVGPPQRTNAQMKAH